MSEIVNLLSGALNKDTISQLAGKLDMDEDKTAGAISAAMPLLISALANNTSKASGAESLNSALEKSHDGSILDNVSQYLTGDNLGTGKKILGHILGSKMSVVEKGLGKAAGLDSSSAGMVVSALAPVLLGAIGKQKKDQGLDASGLASFLTSEKESAFSIDPDSIGILGSLLDSDHDGDLSDDLVNIGGKLLTSFLSR